MKLINSHRREMYVSGETFIVNIEESKSRYYISIRRYGWECYSLYNYKVIKRANNLEAAINEAFTVAFGEMFSEPKNASYSDIEKAITEMQPESVREYVAKYLPGKCFDEHFTAETAPVEMLRDMLSDYFAEYPGLFPTTAPALTPKLTPAAVVLDVYLNTEREIYDRFTVPAIERVKRARAAGESIPSDPENFAKNVQEVDGAIMWAARMVRKYDRMPVFPEDIVPVRAAYVNYIQECAR